MSTTTKGDDFPSQQQLWMALKVLYGTRLVAATLVVIIDEGGHVAMHTTTFPQEPKK